MDKDNKPVVIVNFHQSMVQGVQSTTPGIRVFFVESKPNYDTETIEWGGDEVEAFNNITTEISEELVTELVKKVDARDRKDSMNELYRTMDEIFAIVSDDPKFISDHGQLIGRASGVLTRAKKIIE